MISIIIPIRFRADLTQVCLDTILLYTNDFEIIAVQEGKDLKIKKLLQNIKHVQNKIPKGFSGAMNTGLKLAKGDYYCFLNNDTAVTPNWLDKMLEAFNDKNVGLVTPTFGEINSLQHINYNKDQKFDYIKDPLTIIGVCFLVKKEVMDKIGGWDERFGLGGGEDNDLCARILEAGYKIVIARESFIYHYGAASFRELVGNNLKILQAKSREQFKIFEDKYKGKYNL